LARVVVVAMDVFVAVVLLVTDPVLEPGARLGVADGL
jgi:hypothetical protein